MIQEPDFTYFRGRYALRAALQALGVGRGSSVAIQAFTCFAVPLPVITLGAEPVFIDVDPGTLSMDPSSLKSRLREDTRAIVIQHTFGIPPRLDLLMSISQEHGIPVIEDCCHGSASTFRNRRAGGFGCAAFFSYEWGKPVVAGIGGGLVANEARIKSHAGQRAGEFSRPSITARILLELQYLGFSALYHRMGYWKLRRLYRALSRLGLILGTFHKRDFDIEETEEVSWKMAPRNRARLMKQIAHGLSTVEKHHRQLQQAYTEELGGRGLPTWQDQPGSVSVLLRYPFRSPGKEELLRHAEKDGVELSDIFSTPIHPLDGGSLEKAGYRMGSCPIAERMSREVVSLPISDRQSIKDTATAAEFLQKHRGLLLPLQT